jgi:hypothetical protein
MPVALLVAATRIKNLGGSPSHHLEGSHHEDKTSQML